MAPLEKVDTMSEFDGKVVLVTGGGTGIGAATARRFAENGARLALLGLERAPLEEVAAPFGGRIFTGDAADGRVVRAAVQEVREQWGGIDVLVANAGGHGLASLVDTDDAAWSRSTHMNLDTAFVCARETMPSLIARRGSIVIVSSLAGHFSGPEVVGYVTMKHALIGLTRSIARDYGRHGVRANAVCPGWVRTGMAEEQMRVLVQRLGLRDTAEAWRCVTQNLPLGRAAEPGEVADAILFLASERARMITGTTLMIDGGASAVDLPTIAFAMPATMQAGDGPAGREPDPGS